ncbi:MAG: hypothetical protein M9900_13075 [Flavobacteriales bacterium]|nr:hypothetical protein [Flavobacteriales bacterium]
MKILLIDDEPQEQFRALAQAQEIEILHEPDRHVDECLEFLRREYWDIDAVIVDGRLDPNQQFQGLSRTTGRIQELNGTNHWWKPFCVWTGYAEDIRNVVDQHIQVFDKADGGQPVLDYLKGIIEDLPAYRVKMKFKDALQACDTAKLTPDSKNHINAILRNLFGNSTLDEDYPKHLRSCLESMFRSAHGLGLVHEKCIEKNRVNLTACSLFLSGHPVEKLNVKCTKRHAPELVGQHIHHILNVTNAFSHSEDPIKGKLNAYREWIKTPYLLYSLTFELLDVLVWYKAYAEAHPNIEDNKKLWVVDSQEAENIQMIPGVITFIHPQGYGFFSASTDGSEAYIPHDVVSANELIQGMKIEVATVTKAKGPVVKKLRILD